MYSFSIFEKIILIFLLTASTLSAIRSYRQLRKIIFRGKNNLSRFSFNRAINMIWNKVILLSPTWKTRFWSNLFHLLIVWGFLYYLSINFLDLLTVFYGSIPDSTILLLLTDSVSGLVLISAVYFLIRRLLARDTFRIRKNVMQVPEAEKQIRRDSLIVNSLILVHVTSHILSQSVLLSLNNHSQFIPFAGSLSSFWNPNLPIELMGRIFFWISILSLLVFIPYFPRSKHIHLLFAPINFLFQPERSSLSRFNKLDLENGNETVFGAHVLEELERSSLLDAYACIMCFRCQDVCPPFAVGSPLSPAAYEINKRLYLKKYAKEFSSEDYSSPALLEFAISETALWDCTTCGACVDICPVGIDPLADILQIRRGLALMENQFPKTYQLLFRNIERTANPWGLSSQRRMEWAEGLNVKTIIDNPKPEILWWVGCSGAFDENGQRSSKAFAKILQTARINFSVLGEEENCTGDSVRRAGREDLFQQMAVANIEAIQSVQPPRIVTNCPHCLNSLKNDYRDFGVDFQVIHGSQLITELLMTGRLQSKDSTMMPQISYHDPCYLARFNPKNQFSSKLLALQGQQEVNHPNQGSNTFCCGAGGAQYWKDAEQDSQSIPDLRYRQLKMASSERIVTACPFCMSMLQTAAIHDPDPIEIVDINEQTLLNLQIEEK